MWLLKQLQGIHFQLSIIKLMQESNISCKRCLIQAFQELQGKMIETTQRVKLAEGQIMQLRRNIAHAKLTDQELASLPQDTKTYESIGRM